MYEDFVNMWGSDAQFPWFILTIIAIFISFSLSSIAYMLSKIFESESLFKWAKTEFLYAISTVFVLLLIFTTFVSLEKLMVGFTLQAAENQPLLVQRLKAYQDNPHALLVLYLDRAGTCARKELVWLSCLSVIPLTLKESEFKDPKSTTDAGSLISSSTIVSSVEVVMVNSLHSAMYQLNYAIYSTYLQKHLLLFIQSTMLFVFLPLGILLRTFPFTRGAGNFFIALSIGFYIVYPTAYTMMLTVSLPLKSLESTCGIANTDDSFTDYKACGKGLSEGTIYGVPSVIVSSGMKSIYENGVKRLASGWIGNTGSSLLSLTTSKFARYTAALSLTGGFFKILIDEVRNVFSNLLVYVLLYPLVVLGITLTFIKFFADFLGAGVEDFANGLLRMI